MGAVVLRRGQRDVLRCEPLEALARARLQGPGGDVGTASPHRLGGCLRAVDASRRCRPARPWERRPAGAKRPARVLLDPCVRAPRAARLRGWLRPVDAGVRGPDQHHGRAGPARCPGRHVAHRHRHRRLGRARHRRCPARAEHDWPGSRGRHIAVRHGALSLVGYQLTAALRPARRRAVTEQPFR